MNGHVYFITTAEGQRFKIGYTGNRPEQRLRELQCGSPFELCILATEPGTPATERDLHGQFAPQRLHGEWFDRCDALVERMRDANRRTIEEAEDCGRIPPRWARIWEAIENGATGEEADAA